MFSFFKECNAHIAKMFAQVFCLTLRLYMCTILFSQQFLLLSKQITNCLLLEKSDRFWAISASCSWPLSRDSQPFIMDISEDSRQSKLLPSVFRKENTSLVIKLWQILLNIVWYSIYSQISPDSWNARLKKKSKSFKWFLPITARPSLFRCMNVRTTFPMAT